MTGVELMLAALCLICDTDNDTFNQYPENLILLSDNYDAVTHIKGMEDLNPAEQEGFIETLHALDVKQQILKKLQDWVNGRHLKIATLEDFPLSYTAVNEKGMRVGLGVAFQLVDFLKEKFNFTYEVIVPESNIFGSSEDFTGSLLELLNHSRVHMAAAFLPFLSEQRGFIYYSTAVLDEGEWIMVMRRPSESATGTGLLAPFEFEVWILILISLLVVGPIIYFLIILRNRLTGDVEQKPYSLGHCAWFVYGALMKQGSILSPIADSTRLLFATWWIFITILTSFYTANLTAFLTLSIFTLPFNTVDDILRNNKHFVTMRGGGVEYAIKLMNESLYMLHKMTMNNRAVFTADSNDTNNLISYVEKQGYVFIRDRPAIVHVLYTDYRYRRIQSPIEKLHCPFAESKIPFLKKRRSFAYPMGTNLSELFDWELMRLVEAGIIKHLLNKDLPNAEICPQNLGGTERQLRNGDLIMTYFIIAAGFATSAVIFTTELIFRCINQRKKSSLHSLQDRNQTPKDKELMYDIKNLLKSMSYKGVQPTDTQITPPPPYTIYHKGGDHENLSKNNNNNKTWSPTQNRVRNGFSVLRTVQPPQFGRPNFQTDSTGLRRTINGRKYMMYRTPDGYTQLVPLRAPSATLFEYTYTE